MAATNEQDMPRSIQVYSALLALSFAGCRLSSAGAEHIDPVEPPASTTAEPSPAAPLVASSQPSPVQPTQGGGASIAADAASPTPDLRCQADASATQRTDYSQPGPYTVATIDLTFEDTTRSIAATDNHPAAASRVLPTTIYYPASDTVTLLGSPPVADGGSFPMLMYSHGYSSSRDEATPIANQAASYGYIVVVPEFPLTNIAADGGPDVMDAANQPADVSFLIDQLLAASNDSNNQLAHAVDETRIGALGLSLGGLTTLLVSFHPRFHDPRIQVAMPIAGLSSFFGEGFYHTRDIPMLLLHGDQDAFINYEFNSRRAFTRAAPNARLLTIAKGTHAAFGAQLDPTTIAALNALIAPEGADPTNPDGLGCGAVGSTLQMTGPEFIESMGGPSDFIEPDPNPAATVPCQGDEYKHPAIDANAQEAIAVSSAVAFFDAHLAKTAETRQDACHYLLYELPKNPAVKLE